MARQQARMRRESSITVEPKLDAIQAAILVLMPRVADASEAV
jgi:hypothetical protein